MSRLNARPPVTTYEDPAPSPPPENHLRTIPRTLIAGYGGLVKLDTEDLPIGPGDPVLVAQWTNLGKDFDAPDSIEDDDGVVQLESVLPTGVKRQRIDASVNLHADGDVPLAFSPVGVAQRMRPADLADDELGVAMRLRYQQAACENAVLQLEASANVQTAELRDAVREELDQIERDLLKVRKAKRRMLERQVQTIEADIAAKRAFGAPNWEIQGDAGYRALHNLKFELARVKALLREPAAPQ